MPQTTQLISSRTLPNADSPKWDWRFTAGNRPTARTVNINGSNLGAPPPVLLYMDWHYARTDEPSTLQPIIGSVMGGTTNVRTAWGVVTALFIVPEVLLKVLLTSMVIILLI